MSINYNITPHDKLVDILFNTPDTIEQIKGKQTLMRWRIKNYYYQKKKYIADQYKLFDTRERIYINHLLEEYNYLPSKYIFKDDYVITIDDMLSGIFT